MALLPIVKYGDPVLRTKCSEITEINEDIKTLAEDMLETMYAAPGVGLAAPQIGLSLQICVVDIMENGRRRPYVLINPKIINGENKIELEEGCLSFPKIFEKVKRWDKVTVEYTDLNSEKVTLEAEGFLAKAFQHEIDHLNGKVFIDYVAPWKRKLIEKDIKRRKKSGNW